jgi:DNA-binding NarL/FixJ family response regulator
LNILIADDSAAMREKLVELLSTIKGVDSIGLAHDVPGALLSISNVVPDVAILDIQMPGGSGLDVLRDLKQNHPSTIVIMLTNHPDEQYRETCVELGADYFFSKSTDSGRLIEVVEQLAKGSTHLDE